MKVTFLPEGGKLFDWWARGCKMWETIYHGICRKHLSVTTNKNECVLEAQQYLALD